MTVLAPHSADEPDPDAMFREMARHLPASATRVRGLRSAADLTRLTVPDALSAPQSVADSRATTDASTPATDAHSGRTEANRGKAAPTDGGNSDD